jgi:hypothetical protein
MTDEYYKAFVKAAKKDARRMKRDKKYALKRYVKLGMLTPKGNLTRRWQQIKKLYGITPRHYPVTQRGRG